ncbi:hypothetical protein HYR99_26365 [Candidatus Poribacteria bacterium]|nr:hypothetical protein [Candidatus Poribacteria bacterium]
MKKTLMFLVAVFACFAWNTPGWGIETTQAIPKITQLKLQPDLGYRDESSNSKNNPIKTSAGFACAGEQTRYASRPRIGSNPGRRLD